MQKIAEQNLLIATNNESKLDQLRQLLLGQSFSVVGLDSYPDIPDVEEDKLTLLGNARKKAIEIATATGLPVLADDSGLILQGLGGWPGVNSKRHAGAGATNDERNQKVIDKLNNIMNRRAKMVTALSFIPSPSEKIISRLGIVPGEITKSPRYGGPVNLYGSDPIFELPNGKTLSEIPIEDKDQYSSRARALKKLIPIIIARMNNSLI